MATHRFTADYIFPINTSPFSGGIIEVNDDGVITKVTNHPTQAELDTAQYHQGVLCPGFVNSHAHLELSHKKGLITPKQGMANFIRLVTQTDDTLEVQPAIEEAFQELRREGVVAVGDIANTADTTTSKKRWKEKIFTHTFCELIGKDHTQADEIIARGKTLQHAFEAEGLSASLTPHAPYSVSWELLAKLGDIAPFLSIHNQESEAENELFLKGSGTLFELLTQTFRIPQTLLHTTYKNALASYVNNLPQKKRVLLVHNTHTSASDIELLHQHDAYFCLCPNSNLYIEGELPDVEMISRKVSPHRIVLGTDSLASNTRLSIVAEMWTLQQEKNCSLERLLQWATLNGASFLGEEEMLGSFEVGKRPGVNLLTHIDLQALRLTPNSHVKRLL